VKLTDFLDLLDGAIHSGNGWSARCPAHDDGKASLSVGPGDHGGIVIHCHAGCSPEAVVRSLDLTMKDLAPEPSVTRGRQPMEVAAYPYRDETGSLLYEVIRFEPKSFRQRRPDPTVVSGWNWSLKGVRRVPFRLPELLSGVAEGQTVFVCEGEKDCLAMANAGFIATCNSGGAGKWPEEFGSHLTGADVVIIADRDEPGRKHAQDVASKLHDVCRSIRVIELPDVDKHRVKDAHDFLSAGGTRENLLNIVEGAPPWSASPQVTEDAGRQRIAAPGDNRTISAFARDVASALKAAELFNRGGLAMRLNWRRDGLDLMTADSFRTWCETYFLCVRTKNGVEAVRTMSKEDAGAVLSAPQFIDNLPRLERINSIRLPALRSDGSIGLLPKGYDTHSQAYTLDSCPYREDMTFAEAKTVIADLFDEFQFHGEAGRSRAVAVAALLSLYCGGLLPPGSTRPMFLSLANDAGAGKTTLWRLVLLIVCGSATLTSRPKDEDEIRKALLSVVMQAASYLFLDNLKGHLSSPALEAFVTTDTWRDRVLGGSRMFSGENLVTLFITGNSLTISPDIARRALIVELFQEFERPQDRPFRRTLDNPTIFKLRPDALAACWSLVRAWDLAGRPKPSRTNASSPRWTEVVAGIVEHAGFGCCVVPHVAAVGGDTDAEDIRTLMEGLSQQPGWQRFTDVINLAADAGLFGLDDESLAEDSGKQGARRRVGHVLKRNTGKLFNLRVGPTRLESRKTGNATEYRVSLGRGKIDHIGHIAPPAVHLEPTKTNFSGTDVSDMTDSTPHQEKHLFALEDLPSPRCGIPD
jgi:hypothetical protein